MKIIWLLILTNQLPRNLPIKTMTKLVQKLGDGTHATVFFEGGESFSSGQLALGAAHTTFDFRFESRRVNNRRATITRAAEAAVDLLAAYVAGDVTFDDLVIESSASSAGGVIESQTAAGYTRTLTVQNCHLESGGSSREHLKVKDLATLTLTDNSYEQAGSGRRQAVNIVENVDDAVITGTMPAAGAATNVGTQT